MPEIDIKNLISSGPDKLVAAMSLAVNSERTKEPISFTKVLRTYVFESLVKAEISISTGGSSTSKVSGTVKWIGDRRDGNNGVEVFVESKDQNMTYTFGEDNLDFATFSSERRTLLLSQVPVICPVCKGVIKPSETTISCPGCQVQAHKEHFLEYVKIHLKCPNCNKRLTMKGKTDA